MSILTYQDGSFSINENEIIFAESQTCQSINILLQGKVDVYLCYLDNCVGISEVEIYKNSFKLFTIDKGSILGCEGLFDEGLQYFTYKSVTDSAVYVFCTPTIGKLHEVIESHKEYGAYVVTSIADTITHSVEALSKANITLRELEILTENLLTYFWHYKEILNFSTEGVSQEFLSRIENFENLKEKNILPPTFFNEEFFMEDHSIDTPLADMEFSYHETSETLYYKRFLRIPADARKSFFGYDFNVTSYHCRQGILYLNELQEKLKESFNNLYNLYKILCSKDEHSIINQYVKASYGLRLDILSTQHFLKLIDFVGQKAQYYIILFASEYCNDFGMDEVYIENIVTQAKLGRSPFYETSEKLSVSEVFYENIPEELRDSAKKIVEYSGIDEETGAKFLSNLDSFRILNDKFSVDENTGILRKSITNAFFKIYEGVIKRVIAEKPQTRLYHMFLNFGYMDERLLLPEQTLSLYSAVEKFIGQSDSQVYCMRDWLNDIYEIKKDPSLNEFSMDYNDVFRDMKKRGELTDKDRLTYMVNKDGRLNFEINNMFKSNHRVCYGQPSTYFPILHKDIFIRDLDKALVTPEKVISSLEKILEVDYSAFHREINYKNATKGIEKELLMMQVMPEIILMPTFGSRGIMWQEITGRVRSSPGRFIIPIMTAENLDDMLVKLVGNFRWELCRTMMGVAWNDFTQKSLTSEYTDYIQFYKKNKELSDDNKQKIAVQMVKHRSLMREIFTSDYESWFNYESKGIIRLNKVSRSILYKYCPFNKEIREKLSNHPLFSDINSHYRILRAKQLREVDNHYKKLEKSGIELDDEMVNNLKFYKEM